MAKFEAIESRKFRPDSQGLLDNIRRKGTPDRVYHIELFQDAEIREAISERFDLTEGMKANEHDYEQKKHVALRRLCGFDFVTATPESTGWKFNRNVVEDTAPLDRNGGRHYQNELAGPITSWEDFENYPWPDPDLLDTGQLEWYQQNLPEDMCIIGGLTGHFCEYLTWLMGYETLCFALFEQRDLVSAIAEKILDFHRVELERILEFDRVSAIWGSDDMGFKTGLLFSPADLREFVLNGHKLLAEMTHAAGRVYLLHSCGMLDEIIGELVDDVKIDAKHSFEDTIEDVRQVKQTYGQNIALLGGIDVDFLCRSDETAIRQRVRKTLDICMPGGGYCLGTGNSVANYIPLDSYLTMIDEGMLYGK